MSMIVSSLPSSSNSPFCSSVSSTSALGTSVGDSVFAGEKGTHYIDGGSRRLLVIDGLCSKKIAIDINPGEN